MLHLQLTQTCITMLSKARSGKS